MSLRSHLHGCESQVRHLLTLMLGQVDEFLNFSLLTYEVIVKIPTMSVICRIRNSAYKVLQIAPSLKLVPNKK